MPLLLAVSVPGAPLRANRSKTRAAVVRRAGGFDRGTAFGHANDNVIYRFNKLYFVLGRRPSFKNTGEDIDDVVVFQPRF